MGLPQTKKLLHSKRNHQRNEKAEYRMGEIFANHLSDKRLVSKIYEALTQLNSQKKPSTIKKWNEEFVKPLAKLMRKYKSDIVMAHIDFPYRWKSMLMYK